MERIEDFESFYAVKIQPYLQELDYEESAAGNWKKFSMYTGTGAFVGFFLYYFEVLP